MPANNRTKEVGTVLRRDYFHLQPIIEGVANLEAKNEITKTCREINMSRNQLYMILRGESGTSEETLGKLLKALGLNWDDVILKKNSLVSNI